MHAVPQGEELSFDLSTDYCTAVAIESEVYVFGPGITPDSMNSLLWELTRCPDGSFKWSKIHDDLTKGMPPPRICHCAWEYGQKMWIFGGANDSVVDLAVGNELLYFDPSTQE